MLTAFSSYGQTDSLTNTLDSTATVTIPLTTANRIQRELQDCTLAKLQLVELTAADSAQRSMIKDLKGVNKVLQNSNDKISTYSTTLEGKVDKLNRQKKFKNLMGVAALAVGFLIGSR